MTYHLEKSLFCSFRFLWTTIFKQVYCEEHEKSPLREFKISKRIVTTVKGEEHQMPFVPFLKKQHFLVDIKLFKWRCFSTDKTFLHFNFFYSSKFFFWHTSRQEKMSISCQFSKISKSLKYSL